MTLTRDSFDNVKPTIERVANLNGNEDAYIRILSASARDAYEASIDDGKRRDVSNLSARLVTLCLCDEHGELLFPNAQEGAAVIGSWPTSIVEPLFDACRTLNRMGPKAIEDAAKNSESIPGVSSNTG